MLRPVAMILVPASLVSLVAFGIVGVGRDGIFNFDGRVLYAAGVTWLHHDNPYDHDALAHDVDAVAGMDMDQLGFFYPPQAAAICVTLGLFPAAMAPFVWLSMNLAALAAIVAALFATLRQRRPGAAPDVEVWGAWLLAAIAIGNPFTAHVIWMGQTSLVAIAAIMGTWLFAGRKRWLLAGLCFGLASYKPQLCLLVGLWLLLERDWKTLLSGGATAAAMAIYPMAVQGGPLGALQAWRTGVSSGYSMPFNLPSFSHKIGVESLLYGIDRIALSGTLIMATSVALTGVLWAGRRRFQRDDVLTLLMIITVTFSVYLHDYDYVALIPAYASMWWYSRRGRGAAIWMCALLVILFLPQRWLRDTGIAALEQWRTVVVAAIGLLVVLGGLQRRADPRGDGNGQPARLPA